MKNEPCYYADFQVCNCNYCKNRNKACVGKENCNCFISEMDYFERSMNGTLEELVPKENVKEQRELIESVLRPEKSRKQVKKEAKKKEKELADGSGFSIGDNPAFQQFLNDYKKK